MINAKSVVVVTGKQPSKTQPQPEPSSVGTETEKARVAHGSVVNIRSIPTRGVTRVEIELPFESHVEATSLLFGKDVLIVAVSLPKGTPYGITDGSVPALNGPAARTSPPGGSNNKNTNTNEHEVNLVAWIGARCTEAEFQDWIGARNEADAIRMVREKCAISSRSEIRSDADARDRFISQIYAPYRKQHMRSGVRLAEEDAVLQEGLSMLNAGRSAA